MVTWGYLSLVSAGERSGSGGIGGHFLATVVFPSAVVAFFLAVFDGVVELDWVEAAAFVVGFDLAFLGEGDGA